MHHTTEATIDTANLTRAEAEERAALIGNVGYGVEVDVTGGPDTFTTRTAVRFTATPGASSFIDILAASIESATLNGTALDAAGYDGNRLALPGLAAHNELVIESTMRYSRTGEGLHRFVDPVDDEVYLYSQFEVADARRMYACFEQPDIKADFAFTVTAPARWLVLSNSPTPASEPAGTEGDVEIATWRFEPTPRISTYLTALVAGPYAGRTGELTSIDGRAIPLGVYCRASLEEFLDAEEIMDVTRAGFAFYEEAFDRTYPFAKYDQIFVPEFNAGAMENVGCVTFRDSYVFRSKMPEAAVERRVVTILHELAHMWFGDLVTMKWWNDLWLNESFAEFASTLATAEATVHDDAWTTFSALEKAWAYRQDQLPSTHPIVAPIRDLEDVFVNFDGITYAKGASVLRQLVAYVGREPFFAGLRSYFAEHAWGNTVLADLLVELEAASGRDLAAWSKVWLEEEGLTMLRPVVTSAAGPDGAAGPGDTLGQRELISSFTITQEPRTGAESLRPHRLVVGGYALTEGDSPRLVRTERVELDVDGAETAVPQLVGRERPDLILVNDEDLAYAKIRLDERSLATAVAHIDALDDAHARALVLAAAWDMTRDAEWPAGTYLDLAVRALAVEKQSTSLRMLLANVGTCLQHYVAPEAREEVAADVVDDLIRLTRAAEPGSDAQLQLSRAVAAHAVTDAQVDVVEGWLAGTDLPAGLDLDTGQRWVLVQGLAAAGRADESVIAAELARDDTAAGRLEALHARAARPAADAKTAAWSALVDDHDAANSDVEYTLLGFHKARDRAAVAEYADRYVELLDRVWTERSGEMARTLTEGLFPTFVAGDEPGTDVDMLGSVQGWLDSRPGAPAGQRRLVGEKLDDARRIVRAQEADRAARA